MNPWICCPIWLVFSAILLLFQGQWFALSLFTMYDFALSFILIFIFSNPGLHYILELNEHLFSWVPTIISPSLHHHFILTKYLHLILAFSLLTFIYWSISNEINDMCYMFWLIMAIILPFILSKSEVRKLAIRDY